MGGMFFEVTEVERTTLEQKVRAILKELEKKYCMGDVRQCVYVYNDKWEDWSCHLWVHS